MGKTKEKKSGKSQPVEPKANGVKAAVTKPADTIKAGSKKLAAETAAKVKQLKETSSKKSKKPAPESESETSESSASESDNDDSESSDAKDDAKDDDSEVSSSSSSESSDEESADEVGAKKAKAKTNGATKLTNGAKKVTKTASDESDSSEADSSEEDSEEEGTKAAPAKKSAPNGVAAKAGALSNDSDDDTSDSSSSSDEEGDEDEEDKEAAKEAVAAPKKRKAEADVETEAKKPKTEGNETANLFVGNLSWNVDEEWLRREFAEHGEVVGCRIMTDRATGRSKGFGYVDFADAASASAALAAMKEFELDGRPLNVDFSQPRPQRDGADGGRGGFAKDRASKFGDEVKSSPSDTLFIGNISFSATAESFQEAFGEYGSVTRVSLPTDQETGSLKGFGYVSFSSVPEAQAALEALNGEEIAGRRIRLDFATPRTGGGDRGGRGGGRGRGDRGGFGGRGGGRGFGGGRGGGRGFGGGFGGGRGGGRGGRPNTTERGGFGDFSGSKTTF